MTQTEGLFRLFSTKEINKTELDDKFYEVLWLASHVFYIVYPSRNVAKKRLIKLLLEG